MQPGLRVAHAFHHEHREVAARFITPSRAAMQGKTVVITGGMCGIGEVAAMALARLGFCSRLASDPSGEGRSLTFERRIEPTTGARSYKNAENSRLTEFNLW
jgi:hypothetical protein